MAILYVKKDGSGNSTTIQGAIQIAAIGDTIEIEAGNFDENVDIWKGVTIKGAGIGSTIITGAVRTAITAKTFTWTLGSTTLTISAGNNTDQYEVGRIVSATGIPLNSRVVSKTSTTLVINQATTQATTTARSVSMALQNDATIRVRGSGGVIRDMKVVGFDHPNPSTEYSAIYFRNTGLGTNFANNWEVFNVECEAAGEYALLTDSGSGLGNFNIHDCKFSGKTFVGSNPASGNQFSVWNVPRQLVVVQSVNTGTNYFVNNEVTGSTGGVTVDGVNSYNNAVTFDPVGSVVTGNTFNGNYGTGFALRCRGLNSTVQNNENTTSQFANAGYYILPNHSVGVSVSVGTMIFNSSKYWICTQSHTSDATNAPTGVNGASFWSEITIQQVNESENFGVSKQSIGTNISINEVLVTVAQASSGQPVSVSFKKELLKTIPSVSNDPVFSQESNWNIVGLVYKKDSKRMTSGFKDFSETRSMKVKNGVSGETFQLHRIIISKSDRTLKVVERSEISGASGFDLVLK